MHSYDLSVRPLAEVVQVQQLQREVVAHLMSKDDNQLDSRNAIVEVRVSQIMFLRPGGLSGWLLSLRVSMGQLLPSPVV